MAVRFRSARSAPAEQDPLSLRITTAVVLLGLLATALVAAVRDSGAGGQRRSGASGAPSAPASGAQGGGPGLRLLSEAAGACDSVAYHGVQMLAQWGQRGERASVVDVWHRHGGETVGVPAGAQPPPAWPGAPATGAGVDGQALEGNLGVTRTLVSLLGANYRVTPDGSGYVAGRPARVVAVRRPDGTLAARFWLDSATMLPLRREVFDSRARVVSEDSFVSLTLGGAAASGMPSPQAQPWHDTLASSQLERMRARGWPLPGPLPDNLSLFDAKETTTSAGAVVELSYSDGLSIVSLFVQRGHLPPDLSGWSATAIDGRQVFTNDPDDLSVAWSAGGFVYTLIAEAPPQTVGHVVAALPHGARPGVIGRMSRGLRRILSWANPFG